MKISIRIAAIRIAAIGMILFVGVAVIGAAQFGQLIQSNSDIRGYALNSWADGDELRQQQIVSFTELCLAGGMTDSKDRKDFVKAIELESAGDGEPFGIKACAINNNYSELYAVIENADRVLKNTAWPLSLAIPEISPED